MIKANRQKYTFNGACKSISKSPLNPSVTFPGRFSGSGISEILLILLAYEASPQSFHENSNCSNLLISYNQNLKQLLETIKASQLNTIS